MTIEHQNDDEAGLIASGHTSDDKLVSQSSDDPQLPVSRIDLVPGARISQDGKLGTIEYRYFYSKMGKAFVRLQWDDGTLQSCPVDALLRRDIFLVGFNSKVSARAELELRIRKEMADIRSTITKVIFPEYTRYSVMQQLLDVIIKEHGDKPENTKLYLTLLKIIEKNYQSKTQRLRNRKPPRK